MEFIFELCVGGWRVVASANSGVMIVDRPQIKFSSDEKSFSSS